MTLKYKIKETVKREFGQERKTESPQNWLQNSFFEECVKNGKEVEILLMNGKRITGVISAYDNYSFFVEAPEGEFLIYKHGVVYLKGGR